MAVGVCVTCGAGSVWGLALSLDSVCVPTYIASCLAHKVRLWEQLDKAGAYIQEHSFLL